MPTLTVHLGTETGRATTLFVDVPSEFDPDDVFAAANRIIDLDTDVRTLSARWQQDLRLMLEQSHAPSMSVGDSFVIDVDGGRARMHWVVEPFGFATSISHPTPPARSFS